MRADWIPTKLMPKDVGSYLVVTAKGKVIIDRWDGEGWGLCRPRSGKYPDKGKYRPHKAWTFLPAAPIEFALDEEVWVGIGAEEEAQE